MYEVDFMKTSLLQELDSQHFRHPFTDHKQLSKAGSRVISKAENVYLWDSDGNKILDGMAGLWCVNVGYGRQELIDAATEQLKQLPYYNSFFQCTHPPAIELAKILADITPANLQEVFFTNSGSEANDTVIRTARFYWELNGEKNKNIIISRKNAYHGSTLGGASLGGMPGMHKQGGLPLPNFAHIDQPYSFEQAPNIDLEKFGLQVANQLEDKIQELGEERVAAFVAEPIQGAGGVIVPPASYWPRIKEICNKYDILLVVDEVICGFGRLGKWFGSDYYQLEPDLMPIAKGLSSGYLPIGGVMISKRVSDLLSEKGEEFTHGFTYSGHPAACAVATANIKLMQKENLVERTKDDVGPYLQKRWQELGDHALVAEARGTGLIGALELVKDKSSRQRFDNKGTLGFECRKNCIENGLVMRSVGDTMIISPPLVISHDQIDELIEKAAIALDKTYKQLLT